MTDKELLELVRSENEGLRASILELRQAVEVAKSERNTIAMPDKLNLTALSEVVHKANEKWWQDIDTGAPIKRNKGELLMLIVTEVAEAMEGERRDLMDDKLPHRKMAEVELADALIRILDYAAGFGYDIQSAFEEKMAFNATREDYKLEARWIAGGKQF